MGERGKLPANIVNQKFGRLTVRRLVSRRPVVWECECECGNTILVTGSEHLISGNTKSCGCINMERISTLTRKRPYESVYNNLAKLCSRQPDRLRLEISYEEFLGFTSITECHYCGGPVSWAMYNVNKNGFSYNLDRKDNSLGYTKSNVVVCCYRCNSGKGDQFSYEEWVEVGKCLRCLREAKEESAYGPLLTTTQSIVMSSTSTAVPQVHSAPPITPATPIMNSVKRMNIKTMPACPPGSSLGLGGQ